MKISVAILVSTTCTIVAFGQSPNSTDPLDTWTFTDLGTTNDVTTIAYGNGQFIGTGFSAAAGPNTGVIFTSANGIEWKRQILSQTGGFGEIAYYGNRFITVGYSGYLFSDNPLIATSTDGNDWTFIPLNSSDGLLRNFAYGNGILVAVGDVPNPRGSSLPNIVAISSDATNWTITTPTTTTGFEFSGITYGNGIFVASCFIENSTYSTVLVSSNGTTWAQTQFPVNSYLRGLTFGNGTFVAVGDDSAYSSSDGITWTRHNSQAGTTLYKVAYGTGMFVAVGLQGAITTSPDGMNWTARKSGINNDLFSVCYGFDSFVAVGNGKMVRSGRYVTYRGPVIIEQMTNQVVLTGDAVTLTAQIAGDLPFAFQWQKDGKSIAGATNSILTLTNAQPADSGSYAFSVTNSIGGTNSEAALLAVKNIEVIANGEPVPGSTFSVGGSVAISFQSPYQNGSIFYTLDGSEPDFNSTPFIAPFPVSASSTLRAIAYSPDFSKSVLSDPFVIVILPTYHLLTGSNGGGFIYVDSQASAFPSNSVIAVNASALPGWTFMGWSGALTGASPTNAIVMDSDKEVQAWFGTPLTTTIAGGGTVSLSPALPLYPYGSTVRITAIPTPGNYFGVWGNAGSGNQNPLVLNVSNASPTVSTLFAPLPAGQVALTVLSDGGGHVETSSPGNRLSLGATNLLTAVPDEGQQFIGWEGDTTGKTNPILITMDGSKVFTAHFSHLSKLGIGGKSPSPVQLTLTGVVGDAFQIEATTNFTAWAPLLTLTNFSSSMSFPDPESPGTPRRFYRALTSH